MKNELTADGMSEKEKLARIHDIIYSLIFTSVNLTIKQKEMLAEIRELASEERKNGNKCT